LALAIHEHVIKGSIRYSNSSNEEYNRIPKLMQTCRRGKALGTSVLRELVKGGLEVVLVVQFSNFETYSAACIVTPQA